VDGNDRGNEQIEMGHFRLGSTVISGETGLPASISNWGMVGKIGMCNISVIPGFTTVCIVSPHWPKAAMFCPSLSIS
jgi:hypothetical protein